MQVSEVVAHGVSFVCECLFVWSQIISPSRPIKPRTALITVSLAVSQTPVYTARSRIALHGVLLCVPAFADIHCPYPRRDGQAELIWMVRYLSIWFTRWSTVARLSSNRARRRISLFVEHNALWPIHAYDATQLNGWVKSRRRRRCELVINQCRPSPLVVQLCMTLRTCREYHGRRCDTWSARCNMAAESPMTMTSDCSTRTPKSGSVRISSPTTFSSTKVQMWYCRSFHMSVKK